MTALELKNVSKVFHSGMSNEKAALKNVSLRVESGEMCAVVGASGSGKTTLLKIAGLIDAPTSGSCLIDGEETAGKSDKQLSRLRNDKIGFIFQHFALIDDRSALENVLTPFLFDSVTSIKEGRRLAMQALERVGMERMANDRVLNMSGGERQRIAIARATAKRHSLLLADEPTGQLDSANAESIMQLLQELNSQGTTLLLVTHNPQIAGRCLRQITLRDGEIV